MAARTLSLYTFLLTLVLALGACKKDDFANETVNELNKLADDIVAKVKEGDDRAASIDAAQKMLDEKRPDLQTKMGEIMELRGFQVSEETAANVNKVRTEAGMKVATLQLDLIAETAGNEELNKKLEKLTDDFTNLVDGK
ncbi:MAG: hypothetical protein H6712_01910 [Myxococcales bacterium]|nr:hypothetical protein [Myxococcales bacterium]MCB9712582.1 hypothetical protein [Myxococcales bacterium]